MKKFIIYIFISLTFGIGSVSAANLTKVWDDANNAYTASNYNDALRGYDSILASGRHSAKLYYNLGNTYFKLGSIGKSVLYYNKAQRLAPSDEDIAYNLSVANARTVDKIAAVPEFFVKTWIRDLRNSMNSDSWAWMSVVSLAVALALTVLFLLSGKMRIRKLGFYLGVLSLAVFVVSLIFASSQRSKMINEHEAIVMNNAVSVKSSPDGGSKDIFVLHEGSKVRIVSKIGDWTEIQILDGHKGWVVGNSLEQI